MEDNHTELLDQESPEEFNDLQNLSTMGVCYLVWNIPDEEGE